MELIKIGEVKSKYKEILIPYNYEYFKILKSQIVIRDEYKKGLTGLKIGDIIDVIYLFDRAKTGKVKLNGLHLRGIKTNPPTGLFNTRSPNRINPIGVSTVKILNIKDNIIEVVGLDAFDKSPVIDIKKFRPEYCNNWGKKNV